ncbi:hypothetical protein OG473_03505 [Streptomyces anulatus]|uniref:hypothetical protein n=1 Tax=Streptomyces TaxID=1883 RepID=UPI000BEF7E95|nr:hypothetical protein [Streptomyces sp. or20]
MSRLPGRKLCVIGATILMVGLGGAALAVAETPSLARSTDSTQALNDMPLIVEDFDYPGAQKVLEDRGILLKKGDGGITLIPCADAWDIKIDSRVAGRAGFCFKTHAKSGFLTMEMADAYGVWTKDQPVTATLTSEGKKTVVEAPAGKLTPVGEGDGESGSIPSVLIELRVTG